MSEITTIVGCGLVGRGWAVLFAACGHEVRLYDALAGGAEAAVALITRSLNDLRDQGLCEDPGLALSRVKICGTLQSALDGASWVQESIPEDLDLKISLFADLDRLAGENAILASSTSALAPDLFMADLPSSERCMIAHPCNPPYLMPAVEIVPSRSTSPANVERAAAFLKSVGQKPILLTRAVDGFVLARIQAALVNEAIHLVADGIVSPEGVEMAVRDALGLRWSFMGPFETMANNAPNGFADYAKRLGPMYERVGRQMRVGEPWPAHAIAAIDDWYRAKIAGETPQERQAWRDRELMALARHKAR
jgi:L-gulonate 3-dehydrogenase